MRAQLAQDPNVKMPPAVQAAAARSELAFKTANGIKDEPAPPVTPPVAPITSKEGAPAPDAPAPVAATPPAPVTTVETPPAPSKDTSKDPEWERKYNSMKGRHDALKEQLASMSQQVTNLQGVIASMQAQPAAPTDAAPAPSRLLTADEEREYGADFLTVVGKKAKEEFGPEFNALKRELDTLRTQLGNVGATTAKQARQGMLESLDGSLENWRTINHDESFKDWLRLPDAYSGAIRHELLKAAYERNDTPRVLAFFKGFLAEEAATDPTRGETRQDPANSGKVSLESLAAPGRAKSTAGTPPPAEKPIIRRSDISKFYSDVARGAYRGKDEERARHEAMIFSAEREGRIQ